MSDGELSLRLLGVAPTLPCRSVGVEHAAECENMPENVQDNAQHKSKGTPGTPRHCVDHSSGKEDKQRVRVCVPICCRGGENGTGLFGVEHADECENARYTQ